MERKEDLDEKRICKACGTIKTLREILEECEQGSGGYCYCEFSVTDPETGEVWFPRIFNEYVPLTELDKLILAGPIEKDTWWIKKPTKLLLGIKVHINKHLKVVSFKRTDENEFEGGWGVDDLTFDDIDTLTRIVGEYRKKGRCKK